MKNCILEGQIDLFKIEIEVNYTKEQKEKIEELKKNYEVKEVVLNKSGIATVIVKAKFKPIKVQGNQLNIIYPKWNQKKFFLGLKGEVIAIGVGAAIKESA